MERSHLRRRHRKGRSYKSIKHTKGSGNNEKKKTFYATVMSNLAKPRFIRK